MKIIKAGKVILILFATVIGVLLIWTASKYIGMLKVYNKFGSNISPKTDQIFIEKKSQNTYFPLEFDETSRLFYLCKVWGFVKYYHENGNGVIPNIDSVLINAIPKAVSANNKTAYTSILESVISSIQLTAPTGNNPYKNIDEYILIDNDWMKDTVCLNSLLTNKIEAIFNSHSGKGNKFVFNKSSRGSVKPENEIEYKDFPDEYHRLLGLFRYWNFLNYFYVYKNLIDESWDKVLYDAIPDFRAANDDHKYRSEIYRMTSKLKDSHTALPYSVDGVVSGKYRPNFKLTNIDSTFVISRIRFPEENTEGFILGDIVLKIDGRDVQSLWDSLSVFTSGGNYWSNQFLVCNAMLSVKDSITKFVILRDNDTISITSKNQTAWNLAQRYGKKIIKREKEVLYKWIDEGIAYLDLEPITKNNFNRNYKPIKHAKAIILDLRCYPDYNAMIKLTDAFVPPTEFFAYGTYPDARFPGMVRYIKSSKQIGSKDYFKGRVVILVNEWTMSFSEYLTMALQANPNAVTVGYSSSGADGNTTTLEFPGNIKTIYSGIGIYYPDFSPTQCIGVSIDHYVAPTISDIKGGKDIVLIEALRLLKK